MQNYKTASATYAKRDTRGNLLTTSAFTGSVWKPKWHDTVRLETHFRPVGPMTPDLKNFIPWRYSAEADDFSPWIVSLPIFTGGTANTMTFIPLFENPDKRGEVLDADTHNTPVTEFMSAAKKMIWNDSTGRLKNLLWNSSQGRAAALPKGITTCGMIQGILLQHGEKDYYKKPQMPVMLMLSKSACFALSETLNKEIDGYKGATEDLNSRYVCGDILNADAGRILRFFNGRTAVATPNAPAVSWDKAGRADGGNKTTELAHYVCELGLTLPLPKLPDGRIKFAVDNKLFTPWEKAIRFLDEQEMVDSLVKAYSDLPELLVACLKPYYNRLPAYIKGNATIVVPQGAPQGSTQAQVGMGGMPAAPAQQMPSQVVQGAAVNWGTVEADSDEGAEFINELNPVPAQAAAPAPAAQASPSAANADAKINEAMARLSALRAAANK